MSDAEDRNSSLSASAAEERPRPRNQSSSKKNAYAFKYNIGQRLRLCGASWSWRGICQAALIMIRVKSIARKKSPPARYDRVHADYFVKTSKNEFFKVSEGRLCY